MFKNTENAEVLGILKSLYPLLQLAARYSLEVQSEIKAVEDKAASNFFGAALSEADLAIQNFIEVGVLALFPEMAFFGEEYESSSNTKYFSSRVLDEQHKLMLTLDPIDGTKYYLDQLDYQIVFSVCSAEAIQGAITIHPRRKLAFFAIKDQGCFQGAWDDEIDAFEPLDVTKNSSNAALLAIGAPVDSSLLPDGIKSYTVSTEYSELEYFPSHFGILYGELDGVVVRSGNIIDSSILAFMVEEAGGIVTDNVGDTAPKPGEYNEKGRSMGLVMASSRHMHNALLNAH